MIAVLLPIALFLAAPSSSAARNSLLDTPISGLTIAVGYEEASARDGSTSPYVDYAGATEKSFEGARFSVYDHGEVRLRWKECVEGDNCYVMGALMDRVFFNVEWTPVDGSEPLLEQPTIVLSPSTSISAFVIPFDTQGADGSGSFSVEFDCSKSPGESTKATVSMQLSESETTVFAWRKVCGSGEHPTAELGFFQPGEEYGTRLSGQKLAGGQVPFEKKAFAGVPFYLLLRSPGTYLGYLNPALQSDDNSIVTAQCDGHADGGQVSLSNPVTMFVKYDCKKNGTTELTMTLPIPPFEPLVGRWRKTCLKTDEKVGAAALGVTLNNDLRTVVVKDGKPMKEFDVGGNASNRWALSKIEREFHVTIANTDSSKPVTVSGISTYTSVPNVAMTSVSKQSNGLVQSSEVTALNGLNSATLEPTRTATFGIRIICKMSGQTEVFVSVVVEDGKPVDFSFKKECAAPRIVRRRAMTAANTMSTIVFFLMLAGLAFSLAAIRRARRDGQTGSASKGGNNKLLRSNSLNRRSGHIGPTITPV